MSEQNTVKAKKEPEIERFSKVLICWGMESALDVGRNGNEGPKLPLPLAITFANSSSLNVTVITGM